MKRIAISTLMAIVALTVLSATAMAAPGGNSKGKALGNSSGNGNDPQIGACYVTPNPVALGAEFAINGSGYAAGEGLTLRIKDAQGSTYLWAVADVDGDFTTRSRVFYRGTNTVSVYDTLSSKLLNACSFESY